MDGTCRNYFSSCKALSLTLARYFKERGSYQLALSMLSSALTICENISNIDPWIYADVLFCNSSILGDINGDANKMVNFATSHLRVREHIYKNDAERDPDEAYTNIAFGHNELCFALMINEKYVEGIEHSAESIEWHLKAREVREGKNYREWASIYGAWSMLALGRYEDAQDLLDKSLAYRLQRYGVEDSGYKDVISSNTCDNKANKS